MCEKEKLFLELVEGFRWKYDLEKYPNSLFVFKDDICIFEIINSESLNPKKIISSHRFGLKQDLKNTEIWFNYNIVWSIFETKFEMKYNDIQSFMKDIVNEHFKIRVNAAQIHQARALVIVSEHFKISLHKHFKRKIVN